MWIKIKNWNMCFFDWLPFFFYCFCFQLCFVLFASARGFGSASTFAHEFGLAKAVAGDNPFRVGRSFAIEFRDIVIVPKARKARFLHCTISHAVWLVYSLNHEIKVFITVSKIIDFHKVYDVRQVTSICASKYFVFKIY